MVFYYPQARIQKNSAIQISNMKNIDFLSLDGRSLKTFLMVLEEESISRAANRLGVTQSAVSHLLDKLRLAMGDPLFVRVGRGIAPTEQAVALRAPVQAVLDGLKALTDKRVFDPGLGQLEYTIAANDFQRDLIFPGLLRELADEGVDTRLRFIASGISAISLLRQARCQLLITPFPPEAADVYQQRLFDDSVSCFYDSARREAPDTLEAFIESDYIEVRFDENTSAMEHVYKAVGSAMKQPRLSVPNFSALPAFLAHSEAICVLPSLMGRVSLKGFASSPLPFPDQGMTMYMAWHRRDHADAAHQWLRKRIKAFVERSINQAE